MEHIISIEGFEQEATVTCSCGLLYAKTQSSQERHITAEERAEHIGQSHLIEMKIQGLIKEGDYVIMPKEPSANTVILMAYDYPTASVPDIVESYTTTTKQGKCLTNTLKTDNS